MQERARDGANAWIARFAPLILVTQDLTAADVHARLQLVEELKSEAPVVHDGFGWLQAPEDHELVGTFDTALGQLDSIETDLRKRLARLAPGDPQGIVDYEHLNERLLERAVPADVRVPEVLEITTGPGSLLAASLILLAGLALVCFAGRPFTTLPYMLRAVGRFALPMLVFCGLVICVIWAVCMVAFEAGASERIVLRGRSLEVRKTVGPLGWAVRCTLSDTVPAMLGLRGALPGQRPNGTPRPCVVLTDETGRPVYVGVSTTDAQRRTICDRINAYLKAQTTD